MIDLDERKNKAVNEVFEFASWDMLDLVDDIIGRIDWDEMEAGDPYDQIAQAVEDSLIYYKDQWTIAQHYANGPADLDWQNALYQLLDDISDIVTRVLEGVK